MTRNDRTHMAIRQPFRARRLAQPSLLDPPRERHPRGQSLVEFALVLPMLLVLLLGIADFGRVFSAGITLEAAARDSAEATAIRRLRNGPPSTPGDPAYYNDLHLLAARTACREARQLPNVTYVPDDPSTPAIDEESCPANFADTDPTNDGVVIAVCVGDDVDPPGGDGDPDCLSSGAWVAPWTSGPIPGQCSLLNAQWHPASGGPDASHAVEVRLCYHFTTLMNLHLSLPLSAGISVGEVWLQKTSAFVVDCAPGDVSTC